MGAAIAVGDREFGVGHLLAGGAGCGREGVGSAEIGGFNQVRSFMAERSECMGRVLQREGEEKEEGGERGRGKGEGGGYDSRGSSLLVPRASLTVSLIVSVTAMLAMGAWRAWERGTVLWFWCGGSKAEGSKSELGCQDQRLFGTQGLLCEGGCLSSINHYSWRFFWLI